MCSLLKGSYNRPRSAPDLGNRSLACSVEIDVHCVASPGVCLPKRDAVYLVIQLFGQVCRTKAARPIFPIRYNEKCRFRKVFSSSCELSQVAELLEGMIITIRLMQSVSSYGVDEDDGDVMLAYHQSSASCFLYPSSSLCANTKCRQLFLHRTICFPGENPLLEFASTAIIHETMAPARRQWKNAGGTGTCGVQVPPPVDVFRPFSRSPLEPSFVRYSKPISSYRMAQECKECGCTTLNDECERYFSDTERKIAPRSRKTAKTKRMKSQATLYFRYFPSFLRPCNSAYSRDNITTTTTITSKSRPQSHRSPRRSARASSSEPFQVTCSCDDSDDEDTLVRRYSRKSTKKSSPRLNEARSQLDCDEGPSGVLLRRLLDKLKPSRPGSDGRPPFVIRKVESKEFRRTPGLSDFGDENSEQRRLREMLNRSRESTRETETVVRPQSHRIFSQFDIARETIQRKSSPIFGGAQRKSSPIYDCTQRTSSPLFGGTQRKSAPIFGDSFCGTSFSRDCPICQSYLKYLGKPYAGHLHNDEECGGKPPQSRKKKSRRVEFDDCDFRAAPEAADWRDVFHAASAPPSFHAPPRAMGTPERACPCEASHRDCVDNCNCDDLQFPSTRRSPKSSRRLSGRKKPTATCTDAYTTPDTTDLTMDSAFNPSPYKIPDCSTTARNCYASEPLWDATTRYHESRRRSGRGSEKTAMSCGSPPNIIDKSPTAKRKSPVRRSRKNSGQRLGCGCVDTANGCQPREVDWRETLPRYVEDDSGCTFVTPSFLTEDYSTRECADRFLEISRASRGSPESRSRRLEKSLLRTAASYLPTLDDHRQAANTRYDYSATGECSQGSDIDYTLIRHGSVLASDDLSALGKDCFVSRSKSPRSQRASSMAEDILDLCGDQNESTFTRVSPISHFVIPGSPSSRSRSRRLSYGQFATTCCEQSSDNQATDETYVSLISPISENVTPCSPSGRDRSRKSPYGLFASSCSEQGSANPASTLTRGSLISPITKSLLPCPSFRRSRSRKSSNGQFATSCYDQGSVDQTSGCTEGSLTSSISENVAQRGSFRLYRPRKYADRQAATCPSEHVSSNQTSLWMDGCLSSISEHPVSSSSVKKGRSQKSPCGSLFTSIFDHIPPYQPSVWLGGSRDFSQIQSTDQPNVTANDSLFNCGSSYVSSEQSHMDQYVTSVAPNVRSLVVNGVVVPPNFQPQTSSQSPRSPRRHHSKRSSRRSGEIQLDDCSVDQIMPSKYRYFPSIDQSTTGDATVIPRRDSTSASQYLDRSLRKVGPENFSLAAGGSQAPPPRVVPASQFLASLLTQDALENPSPETSGPDIPPQVLPASQFLPSFQTQDALESSSLETSGPDLPPRFFPATDYGAAFLNKLMNITSSCIGNDSHQVTSEEGQHETTSSLTQVIPDVYSTGRASRDSSSMRPRQSGVPTLVVPPTTTNFRTSTYVSPQSQHATTKYNNMSAGLSGSRFSSHMTTRDQCVAPTADQEAPEDLSANGTGFSQTFQTSSVSSQMYPNYRYFPSPREAPAYSVTSPRYRYFSSALEQRVPVETSTVHSFKSPKVRHVGPNNLTVAGNGSCTSDGSPTYRYFSSESGDLSVSRPPQVQVAASPYYLTRSSPRSSSHLHSSMRTSDKFAVCSRSSVVGAITPPKYFQDSPPPSTTDPCLSSSVAPPSFHVASSSRSPRETATSNARAMFVQGTNECPVIPRGGRRRRKNTFAGNPWFSCSTRAAATSGEDPPRYSIQPIRPLRTACATSTVTRINLSSTAALVPEDNLLLSSVDCFATPQSRYNERSLPRDSQDVVPGSISVPGSFSVPGSMTVPGSFSVPGYVSVPGSFSVPGSVSAPPEEPDNDLRDPDELVSVTEQSNRYGTMTSLEMARSPTQTPGDNPSHEISLETYEPLNIQRMQRASTVIPRGSFDAADDTTVITSAAPPATSTPRNSQERATVSRMFGDESTITKDEPDMDSPGAGGRMETRSNAVRALDFDDHPVPRPPSVIPWRSTQTYESLQLSPTTTSPLAAADLSTGPMNDTDSVLLQGQTTRPSENGAMADLNLQMEEVSGNDPVSYESSHPLRHGGGTSCDEVTPDGERLSSSLTGNDGMMMRGAMEFRSLQIDTDMSRLPDLEDMSIVDIWGPLRSPHAEMVSIHQEGVTADDSDREDLRDCFSPRSPMIIRPERKASDSSSCEMVDND